MTTPATTCAPATDLGWQRRSPWSGILHGLGAIGLNAVGVAPGGAVDFLPGCRSVVVFGSGGPSLWSAFTKAIVADPTVLTAHAHPLDRFIARTLATVDPAPDGRHRVWVRCAFDAERFVDFRPLARSAGLGWDSPLGLLLHPKHGPWMGLRAACFTTEALPVSGVLPEPGPCASCPAPCQRACPVSAVPSRVGPRFDIRACASHKQGGGCHAHCKARQACPQGAASAYPVLEQAYHDDRKTGRTALAAALRIGADGHIGEGPYWSDWAD